MSHYPSTQELAAFRCSIADKHWIAPHVLDWRGHAFPSELRDGIGYRLGHLGNRIFSAWEPGPAARREASALRSRAHAHGFGSLADVQTFAPSPWPDMDCPACHDPFSNPNCDGIVSTDTWTEDEPRSPLPIRYQPSFTIG